MKIIRSSRQHSEVETSSDRQSNQVDLCVAPLAAYDIETTGANPETARIVQAAIVTSDPGEDYGIRTWLAAPDVDIEIEATAVHGISNEYAQQHGMKTSDMLRGLLGAFRTLNKTGIVAICAFNSGFDFTILDREMRRNGLGGLSISEHIGLPIIDPFICDNKLDPFRSGRRTLTAVSSAYGVIVNQAHQAHGDCITTIKLSRALAAKYSRIRHSNLDNLQSFQANAHADFARQLQEYKRHEDPEFSCNGEWPITSTGN